MQREEGSAESEGETVKWVRDGSQSLKEFILYAGEDRFLYVRHHCPGSGKQIHMLVTPVNMY